VKEAFTEPEARVAKLPARQAQLTCELRKWDQ
jgi:hypothetical protein